MKNEGGENTETRSYVIFIIGMILLQYFISTPVFFINDYLICVILIYFNIICIYSWNFYSIDFPYVA